MSRVPATGYNPFEVAGYGNDIAPIVSGEWVPIPSTVFKIRLTGTGEVSIEGRNRQGTVAAFIQTFDADNATDQIEFPYISDNTVQMRFTFPATLNVEVI